MLLDKKCQFWVDPPTFSIEVLPKWGSTHLYIIYFIIISSSSSLVL